MKTILYSTGCPKCKVLEKKLADKGIPFEEITDVDAMESLGFESVPILSVDGTLMDFTSAIAWLNYSVNDNGGCESCRLS